jgi:hypothetical protein
MAKTLSGLPAISPTRGEKTRGVLHAPIEALRSGGVKPLPLVGGVWGGVFDTRNLLVVERAAP